MTSRDFDSEAKEFEASLGQPWNRMKYDLALANLVERMNDWDTPATILDVGAGTGELALRLAERGHEVTLLDPSPSMLAIAERKD